MNKLSAINTMLLSIGESPLENDESITLEELLETSFEGKLVEATLEQVKQEVLADGLSCNTDDEWEFPPDAYGNITIPTSVLSIRPTDTTSKITQRDWKLFDKEAQSFKFESSVTCTVVWDLDFDDLPHVVANYIMIRAARKFQAKAIGDSNAYSYSIDEEREAFTSLRTYEIRNAGATIFDDGYSNRPLLRTTSPSGIGG